MYKRMRSPSTEFEREIGQEQFAFAKDTDSQKDNKKGNTNSKGCLLVALYIIVVTK